MSRLAALLGCLAVAACSGGGSTGLGSASTTPSKSVTEVKPVERWAVLYSADGQSDTYRLALVGVAGTVVSRLVPQRQSHPSQQFKVGDKVPLPLFPYSASSDRLFYLDGAVLKYIMPSGVGGTVRSLGAGNREYAFAVTSDDSRVAIAEFDYSAAPTSFLLWVEDLSGGNRVDLTLNGIGYAWPYGWHKDKLIVVDANAYGLVSTEGVMPLSRAARAHLIDAQTGAETATLCSWPVADRALCSDSKQASLWVGSWDGARIPEPQVGPPECYPTGVLSPDGSTVASRDMGPNPYDGNHCVGHTIITSDASGRRTKLSLDGYPESFLDASHLIYMTQASDQYQQYSMNIVDLRTGAKHPIDFSGRDIHAFRELPPLES